MLKKILPLFFLIIIFALLIIPMGNPVSEFMLGEITEEVKCIDSPEETYAAYVPKSYSPEGRWPVIIAFDPAARGIIPVKLFRSSAEKYGYIVVCSNNSKNGPWKDVIYSMKAVWNDIRKRFSVDTEMIYTTGFSGGSRAASLFAQITGITPAGIIACGAGLQKKLKPEMISGSFYYGIIGLEDFNYKEFQRLVPELKKSGIRYCIDYVSGVHKWPDEEAVSRALRWMEADAIIRNRVKEDPERVNKIFLCLKKYADSLVRSDKFFYGALYMDSIARHFKMLIPVDQLEKRVSDIMKGKKFEEFVREDKLRFEREYNFIARFKKVFNRIENGSIKRIGLQSVLNDLKVPYLLKKDKKKKRSFESYWAKRLLFEIAIKADRYSSVYFGKKDKERAILFAEIAEETGVHQDWYRFRLSSIYAAYGLKKRCFKLIKTLLITNKNIIEYISKDPNFNEMLKDPDFMRIFINTN